MSTGLAKAGYQYGLSPIILIYSYSHFLFIVNLDDCWQVSRDAQGIIQPDPKAFPSGMAALADYVHSKNLKFGLYSGTFMIVFSLFINFK